MNMWYRYFIPYNLSPKLFIVQNRLLTFWSWMSKLWGFTSFISGSSTPFANKAEVRKDVLFVHYLSIRLIDKLGRLLHGNGPYCSKEDDKSRKVLSAKSDEFFMR